MLDECLTVEVRGYLKVRASGIGMHICSIIASALPTVQPYFRSKYPDLPEVAIQQITAITERYGIDPNHTGPRPGEDEQ